MSILIHLPPVTPLSKMTLEEAIDKRHSKRQFKPDALTMEEMSRLLWAAQGMNAAGTRTVPSAGALYPLEIYLVTKDGVYRYGPKGHELQQIKDHDIRNYLAAACVGQMWMANAPMIIVIAAEPDKTLGKYGDRGHRYVCMEAGNVSQNISLQATALGLGTTIIGAFKDSDVHTLLGLLTGVYPLLLMPVGKV